MKRKADPVLPRSATIGLEPSPNLGASVPLKPVEKPLGRRTTGIVVGVGIGHRCPWIQLLGEWHRRQAHSGERRFVWPNTSRRTQRRRRCYNRLLAVVMESP